MGWVYDGTSKKKVDDLSVPLFLETPAWETQNTPTNPILWSWNAFEWMGVSGTKNTYRIVYSIHYSHYALNNTQVEDGTSTSDTFRIHISFFLSQGLLDIILIQNEESLRFTAWIWNASMWLGLDLKERLVISPPNLNKKKTSRERSNIPPNGICRTSSSKVCW